MFIIIINRKKYQMNFYRFFGMFTVYAMQILPIYSQNMICNGNFTGYVLSAVYFGEECQYFPSNYSCWFQKNGGQI